MSWLLVDHSLFCFMTHFWHACLVVFKKYLSIMFFAWIFLHNYFSFCYSSFPQDEKSCPQSNHFILNITLTKLVWVLCFHSINYLNTYFTTPLSYFKFDSNPLKARGCVDMKVWKKNNRMKVWTKNTCMKVWKKKNFPLF